MRTPYPRPAGSERAHVQRERGALSASYRAGSLLTVLGFAFIVLSVIAGKSSAAILGGSSMALGLPWKYMAQDALLKLKGLSWSDCPPHARHGLFMTWYETAPDNYPYWDAHHVGHLPPPSAGE